MTEPGYVLAAILIAAAITWTLRAAPFAMLAPLRENELLAYLEQRLPVGIMLILAAYTLRGVDPTTLTTAAPAALALAVTVGLHVWRGSATLSIFSGTAVYVGFASAVAALGWGG